MIKTPFEPTDFVLGDILRRMAEISPDATYLRFKDQSLTFGQLDEQSDRLAVGLSKLGICRNDRIAVMLPNHPAYVVCVYAIAKLGAVLVPLNPSLRGNLIQQALKTAEPRLLIVHKPVTEYLHGQYENLKGLRALVVYDEEDSLETHAHGQQELILLNQLFERNGNVPDIQCKPGDLQAIMFTSGTTGTSKAVMVPHALGLTCAAKFLETVDYRHDETIYCPLPLFHATGSWEGLMSSLLTGGETAIVGRFSASAFWDDIRHFNANIALGVFSMVPILLNRSPTSDDKAHQLRVFYTGKSNHDRTFSERFKTHCVENYASTEVGIAIAATYGELKEGSCGKVCEDTHEVRIADSEDRELPAGEIGEILVRPRAAFVVTPGYFNDTEATVCSFRNLWFHTGDLGRVDASGHFSVVGRIKDSIRRRGENISAFEVEEFVNSHPAVIESAAIAVPSELEEDELKVIVKTQFDCQINHLELFVFCQSNLPSFMVPRYFEFVNEMPRNSVGKIAKTMLRQAGDSGITPETWDSHQRDISTPDTPQGRDESEGLHRYGTRNHRKHKYELG